jgi:beta-phosphoglucomutase-like phosphatase (HAD superfamily)
MTSSVIAVLDIDGTLIDSNYRNALAWYRALRSVGETYAVCRARVSHGDAACHRWTRPFAQNSLHRAASHPERNEFLRR